MEKGFTLKRSSDCTAHSGIVQNLKALEKATEKIDNSVTKIDDRIYKILIGIIFIIMTTLFSSGTAIYLSMDNKITKHKTTVNHDIKSELAFRDVK